MIQILRDSSQILAARENLRVAGLDTSRGWRRVMYALRWRLRFRVAPEPVAVNKSWDVWTMYQAILAHAPNRETRVFEMGSYNSEISLVLWRAGYRHIHASDFNPLGRAIRWYGNQIDFKCEDFYEPDLSPGSVGLITAVSVIEHGYDEDRLLATMTRLLAPNGICLLSTDYREEGAAVPSDFRAFGLTYRVFSRADLEGLIAKAATAGLELISLPEWGESDYPIEWEGRKFTFICVGFRKMAR